MLCCSVLDAPAQEYIYENGIYAEKIDTIADLEDNPYNWDNVIYIPGREFIFDYDFISKEGTLCKITKEGFRITPLNMINSSTIMTTSVKATKSLAQFGSDYFQTILDYEYYLPNGEDFWPKDKSGVIENEKNVWMHPFRKAKYFQILQINPYPFIQAPLEIGNKWSWSLGIGDDWGDSAWATWEGPIENIQSYEITNFVQIDSNFGDLECYVVESKAVSKIGETFLTAYFNKKYGFVKLEYINIDGSQMNFTLKEVKN